MVCREAIAGYSQMYRVVHTHQLARNEVILPFESSQKAACLVSDFRVSNLGRRQLWVFPDQLSEVALRVGEFTELYVVTT
jgi:hypothetical protein